MTKQKILQTKASGRGLRTWQSSGQVKQDSTLHVCLGQVRVERLRFREHSERFVVLPILHQAAEMARLLSFPCIISSTAQRKQEQETTAGGQSRGIGAHIPFAKVEKRLCILRLLVRRLPQIVHGRQIRWGAFSREPINHGAHRVLM
jgi:hypothetical protein